MKPLPNLSSLLSAARLVPVALLAVMSVFLAGSSAADPAKARLTITVTDIREHRGALMIAVFDEAGYGADKAVAGLSVPVAGDTAATTVDLPPGRYGIKMFHDVDGDGKMGTNPFGMPIEPFAFSNNAPAQFGPATWDAAAFTVEAPATTHTIKLPS